MSLAGVSTLCISLDTPLPGKTQFRSKESKTTKNRLLGRLFVVSNC